ncbi:MAG: hypothetical protein ACOYNN_11530 [Terrimicrobiaceae bacterium]
MFGLPFHRICLEVDRALNPSAEPLHVAAARLDALIVALPPGTDPTLRHYLERQSYTKALDWLAARV